MSANSSVSEYKKWLSKTIPGFIGKINKSVSEKEIRNVFRHEKCTVDESIYDLFVNLNGQKSAVISFLPCPLKKSSGLYIESLEGAVAARNAARGRKFIFKGQYAPVFKNNDLLVKKALWRDRWLPFACVTNNSAQSEKNGDGIEFQRLLCLFIDFDPDSGGRSGQIVCEEFQSGGSVQIIYRTVIAANLSQYFANLVDLANSGQIFYDPKHGISWKNTEIFIEDKPKSNPNFNSSPFAPEIFFDTVRNYNRVLGWNLAPSASESDVCEIERVLGVVIPTLLKLVFFNVNCVAWSEEQFDRIILIPHGEVVEENTCPGEEKFEITVSITKSDRVNPYYYSKQRLTFAVADYYRF